MSATQITRLVLATTILGTLGCAQGIPGGSPTVTPELPMLQTVPSGNVSPDQFVLADRQVLVDGMAIDFEQIRKQLPARISQADAAKRLVKIDPNLVDKEGSSFETQQWGRWGGRGFIRRGFGWSGFGGRWGGWGGWGPRWGGWGGWGGWGSLGWLPVSNCYFPYAFTDGCWSPVTFPVGASFYSPFLYGYGGGFSPFTCGW